MMMEEEEDRAESAGSSCPSVRSDRSKGQNPAFSGEPGPTRGQRSQSAGSSCPSVRSDWSKGRPPFFSGEPGATSLRVTQRPSSYSLDHTGCCDSIRTTLDHSGVDVVDNPTILMLRVNHREQTRCDLQTVTFGVDDADFNRE
ncbi:NLR family CARD domain-containing protein 3 [Sarotherodon galilaeus]